MGDSGQVAAGATAAGGLAKAYAQDQAGKGNQRLARTNARLARVQADQALQAGEFAASRVAAKERVLEGAERAAQGSSGTVVGAGTSRLVAKADEFASIADRQMIQLNARREAYGFRSKAAIDEFEGRLARRSGQLAALQTIGETGTQMYRNRDRSTNDLPPLTGGDAPPVKDTLMSGGDDSWLRSDPTPLRFG